MRSNRNIIYTNLLFTIWILLFISCGKDVELFTPYPPGGNIDDFFVQIDLPTQVYNVNADNNIIIPTEQGNFVEIPLDILEDEAGNLVKGLITVEITEILKEGNMVKYFKPTMTKDEYLISRGEFLIKVHKEGKELKVKEGKEYRIYIPDSNPSDKMKLFYGDINSDGLLIWKEEQDSFNQNVGITEWEFKADGELFYDFGYKLKCDKFKWVNIDKYDDIPDEDKTSVCVDMPSELYTPENTIVFMLYKAENSVIAFSYDNDKMQFCEPYGKVPKGWEVYILAISAQGDDVFHFGLIDVTVKENSVYSLIPKEKSLEDIITILDGL